MMPILCSVVGKARIWRNTSSGIWRNSQLDAQTGLQPAGLPHTGSEAQVVFREGGCRTSSVHLLRGGVGFTVDAHSAHVIMSCCLLQLNRFLFLPWRNTSQKRKLSNTGQTVLHPGFARCILSICHPFMHVYLYFL